jgi:transcriptional regulator with XRE-family HTH domain
MAEEQDDFSAGGLATARLADFLQTLAKKGVTQSQVSAKAGLPPQYLSDIKQGRRPMTELVARRLGEKFDVNFEWFLGTSDSMESPKPRSAAMPGTRTAWLPLFSHPIEGEPRAHPQWDGAGIEIAGAAAARLVLSQHPYVLRFGHDDVQGRLQQGDLILISQAPNEAAEFHVVRYRKKSFLARAEKDGGWSRVANGNELPADCPVTGHCVGIIWSSLV